MTDKNDMRRDFEAWFSLRDFGLNGLAKHDGVYIYAPAATYWIVWQAATERATALERERCALVCETKQVAHTMRGSNTLVDWHIDTPGVHEGMTYAAAIRQGGAHD